MPRRGVGDITPADYSAVFEDNKTGALVLEDLLRKFGGKRGGEGINRLINMAEDSGRRQVLEFIAMKINAANNIIDEEPYDEN